MRKNVHFYLFAGDIYKFINIFKLKEFVMLKLLRSLFRRASNEPSSTETKKCMNCLRRINVHKNTCPYCGSSNFVY